MKANLSMNIQSLIFKQKYSFYVLRLGMKNALTLNIIDGEGISSTESA